MGIGDEEAAHGGGRRIGGLRLTRRRGLYPGPLRSLDGSGAIWAKRWLAALLAVTAATSSLLVALLLQRQPVPRSAAAIPTPKVAVAPMPMRIVAPPPPGYEMSLAPMQPGIPAAPISVPAPAASDPAVAEPAAISAEPARPFQLETLPVLEQDLTEFDLERPETAVATKKAAAHKRPQPPVSVR